MPTLVIPNTFTPNTVALSAQVNANFTAVTTLINTTGLDSSNLANNAVTTAKITDAAVTRAKLAPAAVGKIAVKASQTANYTVDPTIDDLIPCSASGGAFTITLPTAVAAGAGYTVQIKRTDLTLGNAVTIARAASDLIDGAVSKKLMTQFEQFTLVSDGASAWYVRSHTYPSLWTLFVPTFTGFGTVTTSAVYWRRIGSSMDIQGNWTTGTPTAVAARLSFPTGLALDASQMASSTVVGASTASVSASSGVANQAITYVAPSGTGTEINFCGVGDGGSVKNLAPMNGDAAWNGSTAYGFTAKGIPITNWEG